MGHKEASQPTKEGRGAKKGPEEEKREGNRKRERGAAGWEAGGSEGGASQALGDSWILEWSAPGWALGSHSFHPNINPTRHACSFFTFTAGKIEAPEKKSVKFTQLIPSPEFMCCFLLSGSAPSLHPWSGAHNHDPAPPRQAEPAFSRNTLGPVSRPQICPGKPVYQQGSQALPRVRGPACIL